MSNIAAISQETSQTDAPTAISYAAPILKRPGAAPGTALIFGALGLAFLGGCFTLGILIINSPQLLGGPGAVPYPKTPGDIVIEIVLYMLAFSCFIGAFYLFTLAIRWLRKAVTG